MHHYTSGMKSVYTQTCMDGLMVSRQSVGGAGYSAWSGLPYAIDDFSPCVTFEGDNTVMAQQSSRFLQKLHKRMRKGEKLGGLFSYLNNLDKTLLLKCSATTPEDFANVDQVQEALMVCSCYITEGTMKVLNESGHNKTEKTNFVYALDVVLMSTTHIKYITMVNFRNYVDTHVKCASLKKHLLNLVSLYGLTCLQEVKSQGYDSGYFKSGAQTLIDEGVKLILKRLRPAIIPLAEWYHLPDSVLVSAIGNEYGDIYEQHLEWAKNSNLNTGNGNIMPGWNESIMPIIQGKL